VTVFSAHLYGATAQLSGQIGLTPPAYAPDLILSLGPAYLWSIGTIRINNHSVKFRLYDWAPAFGAELVWWRFGDGALSSEGSIFGIGDKKLPIDELDGLSDFKLGSTSYKLYVVKLVLPWP
jgi:hypothetical protein